jgi:hypothetical protein
VTPSRAAKLTLAYVLGCAAFAVLQQATGRLRAVEDLASEALDHATSLSQRLDDVESDLDDLSSKVDDLADAAGR